MAQRLVIFVESQFRHAALVLDAALRAVERHPDVETVAVVNSARRAARPVVRTAARGLAVDLTRRLFNPGASVPFDLHGSLGVAWMARRHGFRLLEPPGHDLNGAAFVQQVRGELRPTLALVLGSLQIFRPPLLDSLGRAVNLHDGLVPDYRGLRTTSWSIYNGEDRTGFTFHDMVPGIDEGPIVHQDSIPIEPGAPVARHRYRKMALAAQAVPDVLGKLLAGEPGVPQPPGGTYYSGADARAITTIEAPETLTAGELRRRLLAFGELQILLDGRPLPVTDLAGAAPGGRPGFCTADGVWLRPARLRYLPPPVFRAIRGGSRR